jgi:hypothetical protein
MAHTILPPPPLASTSARASDWALRTARLQSSLPPASPSALSLWMRSTLAAQGPGVKRRQRQGWLVTAMTFIGPLLGAAVALFIVQNDRLLELGREAAPVAAAMPSPAAVEPRAVVAPARPAAPAAPVLREAAPPVVRDPQKPAASVLLVAAPRPAAEPTNKPYAERAASPAPAAPEPVAADPVALPPFDREVAASSVAAAAASARSCGKEQAFTRVAITFASSGRATRAVLQSGSALAGTSVGSCIATRLRAARVPAFSGEWVTVHTTVTVP